MSFSLGSFSFGQAKENELGAVTLEKKNRGDKSATKPLTQLKKNRLPKSAPTKKEIKLCDKSISLDFSYQNARAETAKFKEALNNSVQK